MNDHKHITCAIDSFMKIWLLTLPEKFQEWYEYHKMKRDHSDHHDPNTPMDLFVKPTFPVFKKNVDSTALYPNPTTEMYRYLPPRWNFCECYEYFQKQEGVLWSTKSIEENSDDIIPQ